eukprot:3106007-Prymnesium_polylepis.1
MTRRFATPPRESKPPSPSRVHVLRRRYASSPPPMLRRLLPAIERCRANVGKESLHTELEKIDAIDTAAYPDTAATAAACADAIKTVCTDTIETAASADAVPDEAVGKVVLDACTAPRASAT